MLKRIHTKDLALGMYLHEFCGSWMEHPFWRAKFLLNEPADLARIQATAITECWIDTAKGRDVVAGTSAVSREEADAQIDTDFSRLEDLPTIKVTLPPAPPARNVAPAGMHSELRRAAAICSQSRDAVLSMFSEARMGRAVDSEGARSLVAEISDSVTRNPGALISLARLKTADDYTYMHSVAVCGLMVALARQLKLNDEQTRLAGMAGLLHDLGKAAIPLAVLNKPGKLTEAEYEHIKLHAEIGYRILKGIKQLDQVLPVVRHHHEAWDGSGYPFKLAAGEIPFFARIVAVADVFQALAQKRPYRDALQPDQIIAILKDQVACDKLDQRVVAKVEENLQRCWEAALLIAAKA